PTLWVTAFVHLSTGLLWSWEIGPGTAAEQVHLRGLLATLSPRALIICDAAYMGYDLVRAILQTDRSFLFRMSSRVSLYTLEEAEMRTWSEGPVLYWPKCMQEAGKPAIKCRVLRIKAKGSAKRNVWLLTDILDPARLSLETAARFYRWRWRNEGVFRIYKRTINKVKLSSRTVRLVRREAELSLLATQVLLAHADLALRGEGARKVEGPAISPRRVLIEIRKELEGRAKGRNQGYGKRLEGCVAEGREQKSAKACREWPVGSHTSLRSPRNCTP
ncbi:transposase, partial [Singulisphaera rosea]